MNISDLWRSSDSREWEKALQRYWCFVAPQNVELERALNALDLQRLQHLSSQEWYRFLHDEYFRWKYTAPNRYATTTKELKKKCSDGDGLNKLNGLRKDLLSLNLHDVRAGLVIAKKIPGLGTAGASGLLSLMYPEHFATVDQFVVKALRQVELPDIIERSAVERMNPMSLTLADGQRLIGILDRKAKENNLFSTSAWTPRKIDMVLWTFGRPAARDDFTCETPS